MKAYIEKLSIVNDGLNQMEFVNVSVVPACREGQRLTYGTARKSETEVVCRVDANPTPHHFRWQFKTAKQQVTNRIKQNSIFCKNH